MSDFEITWGESRDVVVEVAALLDKNGGRFCGKKEELPALLGIDSAPQRLIAKLRKNKAVLLDVHNIVYRFSRKKGAIIFEQQRWRQQKL